MMPRFPRVLFLLGFLVASLRAATPVETILTRDDLSPYRGWIKYLTFLADDAAQRHGATGEPALAATQRRDEWAARIVADPALLGKLRGVQEWAYESPVDDSGQPFKLMIPTDYDPAHPAPLSLYMHGYSGNHLEHSEGMAAHAGSFDVAVLGRSRASYYVGLGEADVLGVLDYINAHWSIAQSRVRLNGGSMGGMGTYRLGSRYPQRFASGAPTCGAASDLPPGNLLTFPLYAIHSDDDWVVPILHDRGPLARIRELGGMVVQDETTGYGHASWDYKEGGARASAWAELQVRPASQQIRHIDFTALDGGAMRSWWARILEWGPAPRPARFVLRAGYDNSLHATLTNVSRLWVMLAASPLDASRPLRVSINGRPYYEIPAPLPGGLEIRDPEVAPAVTGLVEKPAYRLHTPGGPIQLYNGEPLLIVYGTKGDDANRTAMRAAAIAASKSSNPAWLRDDGEAGPTDGVPHTQLLYGRLRTVADVDVTETDLARCHLVLIGSATQNTLVERIAGQLPVQLGDGAITCSDGFSVPAAGRALALVHYNPLAPSRLIYWVASDDARAYAADTPVVRMTQPMPHGQTYVGSDLVIAGATDMTLVAARSFDAGWHWVPDRDRSPVLRENLRTQRVLGNAVADCIRHAAGADFALATVTGSEAEPAIVPGVTRAADLVPLHYFDFVGVMDLSGAEILALASALETTTDPWSEEGWARLHPRPDAGSIHPEQTYRLALATPQVWTFGRLGHLAPRSYRQTDLQVSDAIERFLGR